MSGCGPCEEAARKRAEILRKMPNARLKEPPPPPPPAASEWRNVQEELFGASVRRALDER